MDETTRSEQRPSFSPFLQPADTLQQHWLQKNTEEEVFPWSEYRLHGQPPSLKAFVDLFLLANGSHDVDRYVWVDNWRTFVSVVDEYVRVPDLVLDYKARVDLWLQNDAPRSAPRTDVITIFSTSREAAMSCLDFLVGLPDSCFKRLILSGALDDDDDDDDDDDENRICPFTNRRLEHILRQDAKRQISFEYMNFT
jgi:hypothetical protein